MIINAMCEIARLCVRFVKNPFGIGSRMQKKLNEKYNKQINEKYNEEGGIYG